MSLTPDQELRRQLMPVVTKLYDDMRRVFGDGVRLQHAVENGVEWGKRVIPMEAK